jgi:hypothetical protein
MTGIDRVRLFRAQYQDITISEKTSNDRYRVNGNRGIEYIVEPSKPSCTCPDWRDRRVSGGCKHILAVKLQEGEIEPLSYQKGDQPPSHSKYPDNWNRLRRRTLERDGQECQICGRLGEPEGSAKLHAHHIEEKGRGGPDEVSNLITLCRDCHESLHGYTIPARPSSNPTTYNSKEQLKIPSEKNERTDSVEREKGSNSTARKETPNRYNSHNHDSFKIEDPSLALPPWSKSHPEYPHSEDSSYLGEKSAESPDSRAPVEKNSKPASAQSNSSKDNKTVVTSGQSTEPKDSRPKSRPTIQKQESNVVWSVLKWSVILGIIIYLLTFL